MTVPEALAMVKQVGAVEVRDGNLRLKFPEKERSRLQPALYALRRCKGEALALAAEPTQEQIDQAGRILAQAGVRLVGGAHGVDYAGIWSDLDGPELRAAIAVFHPDGVPIRYLDSGGPMRFKLRRVPGEPVPANVLAAMELEPNQPWIVRDRMLEEMGWSPEGIPWAASLNQLFEEQGVRGEPAKIQPETVKHGTKGLK